MRGDMTNLILVDSQDAVVGYAEKMATHRHGWLHRAFSIVIFNDAGEMLLQRRAAGKYHSAGLWANACCSHPLEGHDALADAHERLSFEMGFDCPLTHKFAFIYRAEFAEVDLTEHEFDHVYFGTYNGELKPNPDEVQAFRWAEMAALAQEMDERPDIFAAWFKILFPLIDAQMPKR